MNLSARDVMITPVFSVKETTTVSELVAHLDVADTAYSKVTIRIGNAEKMTDTELKAVRFRLDSKGDVVASELSGKGEGAGRARKYPSTNRRSVDTLRTGLTRNFRPQNNQVELARMNGSPPDLSETIQGEPPNRNTAFPSAGPNGIP